MLIKVEKNDFLLGIAVQFRNEFGLISEEDAVDFRHNEFEMKSLTESTVDLSFGYYLGLLKQHLNHIEFFILRVKSLNAKIKIPGQINVSDCKL